VLDVYCIAAFNGGPRTALFDGKDVLDHIAANRNPAKLANDFFANTAGADLGRGGQSIAAADFDGDGLADLVTTGDNLLGGGNQVFIFSGADLAAGRFPGGPGASGAAVLANFAVGRAAPGATVSLAAKDVDGDARADLAVGSGAGQPSRVRVYLGSNVTPTGEPDAFEDLDPFGATLPGGVYVG
jgi:hypothetical protein